MRPSQAYFYSHLLAKLPTQNPVHYGLAILGVLHHDMRSTTIDRNGVSQPLFSFTHS